MLIKISSDLRKIICICLLVFICSQQITENYCLGNKHILKIKPNGPSFPSSIVSCIDFLYSESSSWYCCWQEQSDIQKKTQHRRLDSHVNLKLPFQGFSELGPQHSWEQLHNAYLDKSPLYFSLTLPDPTIL